MIDYKYFTDTTRRVEIRVGATFNPLTQIGHFCRQPPLHATPKLAWGIADFTIFRTPTKTGYFANPHAWLIFLTLFRPPTQIDHFCRHHTTGRNKSGVYFQPPPRKLAIFADPPTMPPLNRRGG